MDKYDVLKKYYGYDKFRYPQDLIIDSVLNKKDTIALLPTGFGKSVTFQIPAIINEGITIVISPLIALMADQVNNLKKKGIKAEFLNSTLSLNEQNDIYLKLLNNKCKLLYVSAEKLQNEYFISKIKQMNISMVVIDEAHTILWGEGFREAFIHINEFISMLNPKPVILALTATATNQTVEKIAYYLDIEEYELISTNPDRKNIFYKVINTNNKKNELLAYLNFHKRKKGIIYCLTRKRVEELSKYLSDNKIDNVIYHGGLKNEDKMCYQKKFSNDECDIIVCTNAFGMGIDIPNIRFVICYDIPQSIEDLSQQIGRAARDGLYAEGIVYFSYKDIGTLDYFIESSDVEENIKKDLRRKRDNVVDFCLSKKCRHKILCKYFNEDIDRCLNKCDNCKRK